MDRRALLLALAAGQPITGPLYHVTYYGRLQSIDEEGIQPNQRRSIGGGGYDSHARGRVFLSSLSGVFYWFNKAEDFAEHNYDNVLEAEAIPVVIRVDVSELNHDMLQEDDLGSKDSMSEAYLMEHGVPPEYLEVFTGTSWVPIEDWGAINPEIACRFEVEEDDETGEENQLVYFRQDQPLLPK